MQKYDRMADEICSTVLDRKKISLCVSKDNYAINLYKQQGLAEHLDIVDSVTMICVIKKAAYAAD